MYRHIAVQLIVAFCIATLIRSLVAQVFSIPSGSMEPTLLVGDRILVSRLSYVLRPPARGEIVVFKGTDQWAPEDGDTSADGFLAQLRDGVQQLIGEARPGETDFVKRVIAVPGDLVSCCDSRGRVEVNGTALDEPYVVDNAPLDAVDVGHSCLSRRFDPVLVEPGTVFVLGDHRNGSQDSRCRGTVPVNNVIGRAVAVVWPSRRWRLLNVPATFQRVGPPFVGQPAPPR